MLIPKTFIIKKNFQELVEIHGKQPFDAFGRFLREVLKFQDFEKFKEFMGKLEVTTENAVLQICQVNKKGEVVNKFTVEETTDNNSYVHMSKRRMAKNISDKKYVDLIS